MNDLQQNQYVVMPRRVSACPALPLTLCALAHALPAAATVLIMSRDDGRWNSCRAPGQMYWETPAWMQAKVVVNRRTTSCSRMGPGPRPSRPRAAARIRPASCCSTGGLPADLRHAQRLRPTVDAGGPIVMISTVDKALPRSPFRDFSWGLVSGRGQYKPIFLPCNFATPEHARAWYGAIALDMFNRPTAATTCGRSTRRRSSRRWRRSSFAKRIPLPGWKRARRKKAKGRHGWRCAGRAGASCVAPAAGWHLYVIGADPAEGNPTSDDWRPRCWMRIRGRWPAPGKWEPEIFAGYIDQVAQWYRRAAVMPERNNHGHALILALQTSGRTQILVGTDDKPGWLSTARQDHHVRPGRPGLSRRRHGGQDAADGRPLAAIEADTLRAPEGLMDDLADSYALALAGCRWKYVEACRRRRPSVWIACRKSTSRGSGDGFQEHRIWPSTR